MSAYLIPGKKSAILWAYGPTASIFCGIWIKQSVAMVSIFNLDKVSLKKLFPTMNNKKVRNINIHRTKRAYLRTRACTGLFKSLYKH